MTEVKKNLSLAPEVLELLRVEKDAEEEEIQRNEERRLKILQETAAKEAELNMEKEDAKRRREEAAAVMRRILEQEKQKRMASPWKK